MKNSLQINPENIELANTYLTLGNIEDTSKALRLPLDKVSEILNKSEVKRYIDSVYLDMGYRNKFKLGSLIDDIIESKLEEARESEVYTNKDLLEVMQFAHKMRMDEITATNKATVKNQTNVQINSENSVFGDSNYGKLMAKLMGEETDATI